MMRGVVYGILLMVCTSASLTAQVPDSTSPQLVTEGRAVYAGRAGGALCFTCHGPNGKGIPGLGPDLTDAKWLHGDGGLDFIQRIVKSGVPKPKQSATIMPPMGGGNLSDAQTAALAAYLHSLRP
jgi:mono/diheme cytochrome c family protein